MDLPLIFQIEKVTPDEPYLGLRLDLDPSLVASVLMEANIKINKGDASAIIYRLLAGGQGARLGHLLPAGDTQRISRAIEHLREHFDEPLKIDDIARKLGMSVSGFHHHLRPARLSSMSHSRGWSCRRVVDVRARA